MKLQCPSETDSAITPKSYTLNPKPKPETRNPKTPNPTLPGTGRGARREDGRWRPLWLEPAAELAYKGLLGFRVLGFMVQGFGLGNFSSFRVYKGVGLRDFGIERALRFAFSIAAFRLRGARGLGLRLSGFLDLGFRVLGFRV